MGQFLRQQSASRPRAATSEHQKREKLFKSYETEMILRFATNLLGSLLDVDDFATPITEVQSHELIDFRKELVSDYRGTDQAEHGTPHCLVKGTAHGCNVASPQDIKHGLRVARNKASPFVHENVPVDLLIHGYNSRAPQYVGLKQIPVPVDIKIIN